MHNAQLFLLALLMFFVGCFLSPLRGFGKWGYFTRGLHPCLCSDVPTGLIYSLCSFWDGWAAGMEQVRFTILEGMEMITKKRDVEGYIMRRIRLYMRRSRLRLYWGKGLTLMFT